MTAVARRAAGIGSARIRRRGNSGPEEFAGSVEAPLVAGGASFQVPGWPASQPAFAAPPRPGPGLDNTRAGSAAARAAPLRIQAPPAELAAGVGGTSRNLQTG